MNHRSSIIAAAALVALTACKSTLDVPPLRPFAFVDVNTVSDQNSPTGFSAVGQGVFTRARITGVIGSAEVAERCFTPAPISAGPAATNEPIDPGSVAMTLHGNVDTTTRTVPFTRQTFKNNDNVYVENWVNLTAPPIAPGTDTVIYKVTGVAGGFPPVTLRAPSVATFTPQPVADSASGTGIRVQWTPSPNPNSAMQLSLQYANDSSISSGIVNREIVCIARDDGDFSVNRVYLDEWEKAGTDSLARARQVVFSRFLTTSSTVADAIISAVVRRDTTVISPR